MPDPIRQFELDAIDRAQGFDAEAGIIPAILSTGARARDGFEIDQSGWVLDNFGRNPLVLFNHGDDALPIGRWEGVEVKGGKLRGTAHLDMEDEFAQRVAAKVGRGLINATSVRWLPLEHRIEERPRAKRHEAESDATERVIVFTRSELLEASLVTIPADPGAVILRSDGQRTAFDPSYFDRRAIASHDTATADTAWDGPAAVAAAPNEAAVLRYMHAWMDAEGDPDAKSSYKFPHHARAGAPANMAACRNAMSRLPQADIPEGDRAGVERHIRNHMDAMMEQSLHSLLEHAEGVIDARDAGVFTPDEQAAAARLYERIAAAVLGGAPLQAQRETEQVLDQLVGMIGQLTETVAVLTARPRLNAADMLVAQWAAQTGRSVETLTERIRRP